MLTNETRRELLNRVRSTGYPGGIAEVFQAADQGIDLIDQYQMQQEQEQMQVASTPQEQEIGLREQHAMGNTQTSMAFPDVQPNQSFNTVGMKAPINIDKIDNQGHLVESYQNVPPGIQDLPTGPYEGTVIESPAAYQTGGVRKYHEGGTAEQEHMDMMNMGTLDAHNAEGNTGGDTGSMYGPNSDNPTGPPMDYGLSWSSGGGGIGGTGLGLKGFGKEIGQATDWAKDKWSGMGNWGKAGVIGAGVGLPLAAVGSGLINPSKWFQKGGAKREKPRPMLESALFQYPNKQEELNEAIDKVVKLEKKSNRPKVKKLLEATNFMENSMGKNPEAYGRSYTNSQASIDPITFTDLFSEKTDSKGKSQGFTATQKKYFKKLEEFGLPSDSINFKKELQADNPLAATYAMRMVYGKSPKSIPEVTDTLGMFHYYNDNYRKNNKITDLTESKKRFYEGYKKKFKPGGFKARFKW